MRKPAPLAQCLKIVNYYIGFTDLNRFLVLGYSVLQNIQNIQKKARNVKKMLNTVDNAAKMTTNESLLKLQVTWKPEFRKISRDGELRAGWSYMGNWLRAYFWQTYRLPIDNELTAIAKKLQQLKGKVEKVVIYDRRPESAAPIIYEWYQGRVICDGLAGKLKAELWA